MIGVKLHGRNPPCFHGCHFPLYQHSWSRWHPGMRGSLGGKKSHTQTMDELPTLILKWNNFEFNGSKALLWVPKYANIFMGHLEGQLLRSVALRPFSWLRFIDDIDMKWSHGRETLTTFLDNFHPSIKVTAEISTKQHVFLDNQIKSCGRYNICWTNRYPPVSPTDKLPPETLLQKCSLQPCTSPQTYLLRFGWESNRREDLLSYRPKSESSVLPLRVDPD